MLAVISPSETLQAAINALQDGSLFALFALPIALIFGIMRLVNFAHGEFIMVGAMLLTFMSGWNFAIQVIIVIVAVMVLALASERVVFRPLRGVNPVTLLVASFALSIALQSAALLIVDIRPKSARVGPFLSEFWNVGDVGISRLSVATIAVTVVLLGGLTIFLGRHRVGVQMRAAAIDFEMSRLVGVKANVVIGFAFAISGILAGVAAVLVMARTGAFVVTMGLTPVLFGFIAAVLGGLGSLPGAVLGGYMLAGAQTALQIGLPAEFKPFRDAFLFGAVLIFMVFKPSGLVIARGERTRV